MSDERVKTLRLPHFKNNEETEDKNFTTELCRRCLQKDPSIETPLIVGQNTTDSLFRKRRWCINCSRENGAEWRRSHDIPEKQRFEDGICHLCQTEIIPNVNATPYRAKHNVCDNCENKRNRGYKLNRNRTTIVVPNGTPQIKIPNGIPNGIPSQRQKVKKKVFKQAKMVPTYRRDIINALIKDIEYLKKNGRSDYEILFGTVVRHHPSRMEVSHVWFQIQVEANGNPNYYAMERGNDLIRSFNSRQPFNQEIGGTEITEIGADGVAIRRSVLTNIDSKGATRLKERTAIPVRDGWNNKIGRLEEIERNPRQVKQAANNLVKRIYKIQ